MAVEHLALNICQGVCMFHSLRPPFLIVTSTREKRLLSLKKRNKTLSATVRFSFLLKVNLWLVIRHPHSNHALPITSDIKDGFALFFFLSWRVFFSAALPFHLQLYNLFLSHHPSICIKNSNRCHSNGTQQQQQQQRKKKERRTKIVLFRCKP